MKKINLFYSVFLLLTVAVNLCFHFNATFRQSAIFNVFALNKTPQKVDAKVMGYAYAAKGSSRGGTSYNYDYGFTYSVNNNIYFGRYRVVENEDWKYTAYTPLPKTVQIIVDKNNPQQFIYLKTHFGKGFMFYCFNLIFFVLAIFLLLYRKRITTEAFTAGFKLEKNRNRTKGILGAVGVLIFLFLPLVFTASYFASFYYGKISKDVTSFEIVQKNHVNRSEEEPLIDNASRSTVFKSINTDMQMFGASKQILSISGFEDKSINTCYALTDHNEKVELEFTYVQNEFKIYQPRELQQRYVNIYAVSDHKKYFFPIDMLQYDSEYK